MTILTAYVIIIVVLLIDGIVWFYLPPPAGEIKPQVLDCIIVSE